MFGRRLVFADGSNRNRICWPPKQRQSCLTLFWRPTKERQGKNGRSGECPFCVKKGRCQARLLRRGACNSPPYGELHALFTMSRQGHGRRPARSRRRGRARHPFPCISVRGYARVSGQGPDAGGAGGARLPPAATASNNDLRQLVIVRQPRQARSRGMATVTRSLRDRPGRQALANPKTEGKERSDAQGRGNFCYQRGPEHPESVA